MIPNVRFLILAFTVLISALACSSNGEAANTTTSSQTGDSTTVRDNKKYPASAEHTLARLQSSTRHAEYIKIPLSGTRSLDGWIVYPERSTKAPVVVVIHEIYGLTNWVRAVADQLAADGFIAIAPDLLTFKRLSGSPDSAADQARFTKAVSSLTTKEVRSYLEAAVKYGKALPSASGTAGVVGFCWGGGMAFQFSTSPDIDASVVYYGPSPDSTFDYSSVKAPVLGLYAGNDERVNSTIPTADSAMSANRKIFEHFSYENSGHGFLRQRTEDQKDNIKATKEAWPATIAWFKRYLEER